MVIWMTSVRVRVVLFGETVAWKKPIPPNIDADLLSFVFSLQETIKLYKAKKKVHDEFYNRNKMEMFDIRSFCSIRTMCGIVCLWLGLSLMQLPFTSALLDQTKAGVPSKMIGSGPNCTNVRSLFESRGINSNDVPSEAINGNRDASYDEYLSQLKTGEGKQCRYGVYDYEYTYQHQGTESVAIKQKLFLMLWCPDTAPVSNKMIYASSYESLKQALVGIQKYIQASDDDEASQESVEEVLRSTDRK